MFSTTVELLLVLVALTCGTPNAGNYPIPEVGDFNWWQCQPEPWITNRKGWHTIDCQLDGKGCANVQVLVTAFSLSRKEVYTGPW